MDNKIVTETIPEKDERKSSRKRAYILIAVLLLIILLILLLQRCTQGNPVDGGVHPSVSDSITNGSLTPETTEPIEPDYFNVKINATPVIENGKMNLRAENNSENKFACQIEVVVQRYKDETAFPAAEKIYTKRGEQFYAVSIDPDTKSYKLTPIDNITSYQYVSLDDYETVIYQSDKIFPNQSLEYCTITENLEKGKYFGTAKYTLYDPESGEQAGVFNVMLDITVK